MTIHVYSAPRQPATRFVDRVLDREFVIEWSPHKLVRCYSCGRRRRARNAEVQTYYDGVYVFCAGKCAPKKRRRRIEP